MVENEIIQSEHIINSKRFESVANRNVNFQRLSKKFTRIYDELVSKTIKGKYRNHKLNGVDCNELHIDGDILLIWKYYTVNNETFLLLLDIVDHDTLSTASYNRTIKKLIKMVEGDVMTKTAIRNNNLDEAIIKYDFINNIDKFIEDLYNLRKESITKDGEFGIGNLIFKEFRNKGYLDKLKELKIELENKEMSLENLQN